MSRHSAHLDGVGDLGRGVNAIENFLTHLRDDPAVVWSSHHTVGLASASLAICKNAHIVAFKGVIQHFSTNAIEDNLLCGKIRSLFMRVKGIVERKSVLFGSSRLCDLRAVSLHLDNAGSISAE